jgi:putative membrane protein
VLPSPALWKANPTGGVFFQILLNSSASLHILLGAITLFLFGMLFLGRGKTLIFFIVTLCISLSMELLTVKAPASTYALFSGFEIFGLIPYTIPFAWFIMTFSSYLLGKKLAAGLKMPRVWSFILGIYFLTTWSMALEVALAQGQLPARFLVWREYGTYFGLTMQNLPILTLNGLLIMTISRFLWRTSVQTQQLDALLPFSVYTANLGVVVALNLGLGHWPLLFITLLLILLPEILTLFPWEEAHTLRSNPGRAAFSQSVWLLMRLGSRFISRRAMEIQVEGLEYVPRTGAVLIAARHVHFFYDGYILLRAIPRRLHTIVALDWLHSHLLRHVIEVACALADWPVILRSEQFALHDPGKTWAYSPNEVREYLRRVTLDSARLLRSGEVLVIFPEGYPNLDPHPTPKSGMDSFLPFRSGFIKLVELAERDGQTHVAIVPAGLNYSRADGKGWQATVRFSHPLFRSDFASSEQAIHAVEQQVHLLSAAVLPAYLPAPKAENPPS